MDKEISFWFVGIDGPELDKVEFYPEVGAKPLLSVRGKTGGAFKTNRTFQWTTAVQAVALLFLRYKLSGLQKATAESSDAHIVADALSGAKGSHAYSLDAALTKQPLWLLDVFGSDVDGKSYLRRLISRTNPGGRRAGPIVLALKSSLLPEKSIRFYHNDKEVTTTVGLLTLLRSIEKSVGGLELINSSRQEEHAAPTKEVVKKSSAGQLLRGDFSATFKTPFVHGDSTHGPIYSRVYESGSQLALVSLFCSPQDLDTSKETYVRVHSSCAPSEILGALDCDCKSQLLASQKILRQKKGVLIYLFQEGRGAGLYTKYLGMARSATYHVNTYDAYRELNTPIDSRSYELAAMVLQDLGLSDVALLTNNPKKVEGLMQKGFNVKRAAIFGDLAPQNIGYLYTKYKEGQHNIAEVFSCENDFLFCESREKGMEFKKVYIFAGDDTLWEDNVIYEDIIRQFLDYVTKWIPDLSRPGVRALIDVVERDTITQFGLGAPGFVEALQRVHSKLCEEYGVSIPAPSELLMNANERLSKIPLHPPIEAANILAKLREQGAGLVLLTQGPLDIQLAKIARSDLGKYFHAIGIAPIKTAETFKKIISKISFSQNEIIIVGNNLESEIRPAAELNLKSFYYRNPNSWNLLNRTEVVGGNLTIIDSLQDLLSVYPEPASSLVINN